MMITIHFFLVTSLTVLNLFNSLLHPPKLSSLVISMSTTLTGYSHSYRNDRVGSEAEEFSILNDLSQLINTPTRIPDRPTRQCQYP